MSVTPEQLARWRKIVDAATPGPWSTSSEWSVRGAEDELLLQSCAYDRDERVANSEFAAEARTFVSALIDEVERLQDLDECVRLRTKQRDAWRAEVAKRDAEVAKRDAEIAGLRAELSRRDEEERFRKSW